MHSQSSGENSVSNFEMNKKRKLQHELDNPGLPLRKYKFRDHNENSPEEPSGRRTDDASEQAEESGHGSNSFSGAYDTRMEFDIKGKEQELPMQPFYQDLPSTSNHSDDSIFKNMVYSLDSPKIKKVKTGIHDDIDDTLQFKLGSKAIVNEYPGLGFTGDYIIPELGEVGLEPGDAFENYELVYSNGVAPNAFLLAPGMWNVEQDAPLGTRKPTIDQEFEQYFSMLML